MRNLHLLTASGLVIARPLRLRLAVGRLALATFALNSRLLTTVAPVPPTLRKRFLAIRLRVRLAPFRLRSRLARLRSLLITGTPALIQWRRRPA